MCVLSEFASVKPSVTLEAFRLGHLCCQRRKFYLSFAQYERGPAVRETTRFTVVTNNTADMFVAAFDSDVCTENNTSQDTEMPLLSCP